jgi:DnaJ-class molecular chaperone
MASKAQDKRKPEKSSSESASVLNPGDQAKPGTPGTGENVCVKCHGTGRIGNERCDQCGGSGRVIEGIGGG